MSANIFETVGKIAGIGGLALGVFLLLFRDVIRRNIFPTLSRDHGFRIIRLFLVLTFGIASLGLGAYVYIATAVKATTANRGQKLSFSEQHALDLEAAVMTLKGAWENADNSPQDKNEVIRKAPQLADQILAIDDNALGPAYRVLKAEYAAYSLAMAASVAPAGSEVEKQTKLSYARTGYNTAMAGLHSIELIRKAPSTDPESASAREYIDRVNADDRLRSLAAMCLCRQNDLERRRSLSLEAVRLIENVSTGFRRDYPPEHNSELNCLQNQPTEDR